MGKKKYNAPDDIKLWCPIMTVDINNTCKFLVQSKCLYGCIHENNINDWKTNNIYIKTCLNCLNYIKIEENIDGKKKGIKKQKVKKDKPVKDS